jgi:hypothetical protein
MVVKVKMLNTNGRLVEVRIRKNRRIAMRLSDLQTPPPGRVALRCMGEELEARFVAQQFGYAVYYVPAASWRRLLGLLSRYDPLPCVLVSQ